MVAEVSTGEVAMGLVPQCKEKEGGCRGLHACTHRALHDVPKPFFLSPSKVTDPTP